MILLTVIFTCSRLIIHEVINIDLMFSKVCKPAVEYVFLGKIGLTHLNEKNTPFDLENLHDCNDFYICFFLPK